ncbi:MAG: replication protein [Magnetococcales bacterium]|nr:replication protein [Magnetococcales bacterium]
MPATAATPATRALNPFGLRAILDQIKAGAARIVAPIFRQIPHDIGDALPQRQFSRYQRDVLDIVLHYGIGFHKDVADVSITFISKKTGIDRAHVSRALSSLIAANVLRRSGGQYGHKYEILPIDGWGIPIRPGAVPAKVGQVYELPVEALESIKGGVAYTATPGGCIYGNQEIKTEQNKNTTAAPQLIQPPVTDSGEGDGGCCSIASLSTANPSQPALPQTLSSVSEDQRGPTGHADEQNAIGSHSEPAKAQREGQEEIQAGVTTFDTDENDTIVEPDTMSETIVTEEQPAPAPTDTISPEERAQMYIFLDVTAEEIATTQATMIEAGDLTEAEAKATRAAWKELKGITVESPAETSAMESTAKDREAVVTPLNTATPDQPAPTPEASTTMETLAGDMTIKQPQQQSKCANTQSKQDLSISDDVPREDIPRNEVNLLNQCENSASTMTMESVDDSAKGGGGKAQVEDSNFCSNLSKSSSSNEGHTNDSTATTPEAPGITLPRQLSGWRKAAALKLLNRIDTDIGWDIIQEMTPKLEAGTIKDPVRYLAYLVNLAVKGEFVSSIAQEIADRAERERVRLEMAKAKEEADQQKAEASATREAQITAALNAMDDGELADIDRRFREYIADKPFMTKMRDGGKFWQANFRAFFAASMPALAGGG